MKKLIKKSPTNWSKIFGFVIHDIDGWRIDKKNFNTPITKTEFLQRAKESTIIGDLASMKKYIKKLKRK